MATVEGALEAVLLRFGVETEYHHCQECGCRLNEWWVDVKQRYVPETKGMVCKGCGTVSDYLKHKRRVKSWARPIADYLRTQQERV